jgi:hypothetical protein
VLVLLLLLPVRVPVGAHMLMRLLQQPDVETLIVLVPPLLVVVVVAVLVGARQLLLLLH